MKKFLIVLAAALAVSLGCNMWQLLKYKEDVQPHYFKEDTKYVNEAIKLWSIRTRATPEHAMSSRYPQVVYTGSRVCVALLLKRGSVGGNPAYCFSSHSGEVVERYEDEQ